MASQKSVWHEKVDFVCYTAPPEDVPKGVWVLAFRVRECNSLIIGQVPINLPACQLECRERLYWFPKIGEVQIRGRNLPFKMLNPRDTADEFSMMHINMEALFSWYVTRDLDAELEEVHIGMKVAG